MDSYASKILVAIQIALLIIGNLVGIYIAADYADYADGADGADLFSGLMDSGTAISS